MHEAQQVLLVNTNAPSDLVAVQSNNVVADLLVHTRRIRTLEALSVFHNSSNHTKLAIGEHRLCLGYASLMKLSPRFRFIFYLHILFLALRYMVGKLSFKCACPIIMVNALRSLSVLYQSKARNNHVGACHWFCSFDDSRFVQAKLTCANWSVLSKTNLHMLCRQRHGEG